MVEAIRKQAAELIHVDNTFYTEPQGRLAQMLSERGFGGKCFFCNSGAEANEAAIKLARLYTPTGKYKIITMRTASTAGPSATMSATAQPKYHEGFEPLLPGFVYVPFNDVDARCEAAIDRRDRRGHGRAHPGRGRRQHRRAAELPAGDPRGCATSKGAVLIFDEVQTGMGRTGKWFGYQHCDVEPDIMTLAKALGGGAAIGAMMARPEIAACLMPGHARLDLRRQLPGLRRGHRHHRGHRRGEPAPARRRDGRVRPAAAAGAEGEALASSTTSAASG